MKNTTPPFSRWFIASAQPSGSGRASGLLAGCRNVATAWLLDVVSRLFGWLVTAALAWPGRAAIFVAASPARGRPCFFVAGRGVVRVRSTSPPPRPPRPPTHHSQRASTCAGIATALRQRRRGLCCSASLRGALPAPWRAWHCIAVQGDIGARIVQAGMQKAHAQIGHFFACLAWQWQRALGLGQSNQTQLALRAPAYAARAPLACLA